MVFKNKKKPTLKKLTRKQQRKEMRKDKKARRNEFYSKKKIPAALVPNPERTSIQNEKSNQLIDEKPPEQKRKFRNDVSANQINETTVVQSRKKEMERIQKEMAKQRKKQQLLHIEEEDRIIKKMEKQLGLKKKKAKSIPKFMMEDGFDYISEVFDPELMKNAAAADHDINEANDDFDEDFELMTKQSSQQPVISDEEYSDFDSEQEIEKDQKNGNFREDDFSDESDDEEFFLNSDSEEILEEETVGDEVEKKPSKSKKRKHIEMNKKKKKLKLECSDSETEQKLGNDKNYSEDDEVEEKPVISKKRKHIELNKKKKKLKLECSDSETEQKAGSDENCSDIADETLNNSGDDGWSDGDDGADDDDGEGEVKKGVARTFDDGTWEDIYGRKRGKDGSVITNNQSKYIPPAMREKLNGADPGDKKRKEKLTRLKRQLKGYINRLAESNMHHISTQIEELYMNNSRNDMNDTLTLLIMESLVSSVMSPERLLIEHIVLIAILHANVGTEVGAHFLQYIVQQFDEFFTSEQEVENKKLDNIVCIIAQLYNFKLFDSKLIYDILKKFVGKFKEKDVECILHILKSVGFTLRKEDPLALKNLILDIQNQAANVSEEERDNSRVKFMLDILLAIKNNNVTKIPNYDTSYSEHMKKVMKAFIRKGNYVTQLNISLEDLLNASERGRWWVVGSAWTGNQSEENEKSEPAPVSEGFSAKLLELARKQRMNTDTRRNIFCIIMSAEDYMDAFEKIVKLGLRNQQDREIINVLLHCCLQEKNYNPYYGVLAQKFCELDRKYQITIKYSIWDKLKALSDHSGSQISNLAKLLIHLFIEKGLPISTLKIMQFTELDKITLRFMRQILLGILLHEDAESCLAVFAKVAQSDKLKLFRESLRLFIHHFLLRNLKSDKIPEVQRELLETRAKMVEKLLLSKDRVT
ncbi:nucleolar MIF4G domain-containing protein 1 homolog [Leptinotarsa decemlineata]|uniref:nucleolar MIF4G domain-containing protein 1 homolog n=1 Tax=Leptinotarsa decemlineata TaxID=7539 RepID=UPI003D307DF9